MIILAILLILFGLLMLVRPTVIWTIKRVGNQIEISFNNSSFSAV
ncbi:DUF6199 family natural product biosynthesis protein [Paenibacillus sp. GCM10027629]